MTCPTCDGYEMVEIDGQHLKVVCPDCGPEIVVCPVHSQRVMTRGGRIVGTCWGCAKAAADGLLWLREHPGRKVAA